MQTVLMQVIQNNSCIIRLYALQDLHALAISDECCIFCLVPVSCDMKDSLLVFTFEYVLLGRNKIKLGPVLLGA